MTSLLPSILNFRDVGKTINAFSGRRFVRSLPEVEARALLTMNA